MECQNPSSPSRFDHQSVSAPLLSLMQYESTMAQQGRRRPAQWDERARRYLRDHLSRTALQSQRDLERLGYCYTQPAINRQKQILRGQSSQHAANKPKRVHTQASQMSSSCEASQTGIQQQTSDREQVCPGTVQAEMKRRVQQIEHTKSEQGHLKPL